MGSQWTGMGKELMQIPVFKSSIEKCDKVLRPKGIDIVYVLTSADETIYDSILNCFVGITAIQVNIVLLPPYLFSGTTEFVINDWDWRNGFYYHLRLKLSLNEYSKIELSM